MVFNNLFIPNQDLDVVGNKFMGRMCLETCCSECEKVTGREETFLEVCVPVKTEQDFNGESNHFFSHCSNICCPRDCVSRHNGGTSGAPLKPLETIVLSEHYRL